MKGIQFTSEEKQLLIEALLFAGVTDICSEWTQKHSQMLIELAKKVNDPNIKLSNIYIFDDYELDDKVLVKQITKDFPNISRTGIEG